MTDHETTLSSTLLQLEVLRVLRREKLDLDGENIVLRGVRLISIDDGLLRAAGAIKPHVKALDAIHLATCLELGSQITLVTHDQNMRGVAQKLGLEVFDPLLA